MSQHTPGPWTASEIEVSRDGDPLDTCTSWHVFRGKHVVALIDSTPTGRANARLIAAAPAMWNELERLADEMQSASSAGDPLPVSWLDARIKRVRALLALAKTKGGK